MKYVTVKSKQITRFCRIFDITKNFKGTLARPWGWGAAGLQPPPKRHLKEADFVEKIIAKFLHERGFSLNQPLKSAEDQV